MARIVKRLRNGPYSVMVDGQNKAFCGCGLSGTAPYCDGAHKATKSEDPGKLYWYDSSRQRHLAADAYPQMCTEQELESW
jgi:CDGSH-type Zn-finger protein